MSNVRAQQMHGVGLLNGSVVSRLSLCGLGSVVSLLFVPWLVAARSLGSIFAAVLGSPQSRAVPFSAPRLPGEHEQVQRWLRLSEHRTGFDKWSPAGLTSVQSCPRRRAGVACDERTTDAVGNSCSPLMLPVGSPAASRRRTRRACSCPATNGADACCRTRRRSEERR